MPDPDPQLLRRAALEAAERGWRVHPLLPGRKASALHGEARCPGTGDCARGHRKWEQRATCDRARIRAAWDVRPYNVGLAPGPSGLVVIDLDMLKPDDPPGTLDGPTALHTLAEQAGAELPRTYSVSTPSGGTHLYFAAPARVHLPSTKGELAAKIDTRVWGGNVVAAGSTSPSGRYEVADPAPVAPLPHWLTRRLQPRPEQSAPVRIAAPRDASRVAQVALEREAALIEGAPKGSREATLFKAARAMGRFVAWGDIDRGAVEEAFQAAGQAAGLKPHECRSTLRSALNWSIRTARPRGAA